MESRAYQDEFIEFESELKSFIYRLVAHHQDMEDIVQDTYLKAFNSLDSFQERSSFKTWVFTIATNKAKDHLRGKKRWTEDYQDNCRTATYASADLQQKMADVSMNSPHGKFVLKEHIDYCFTCMSKTLLMEEQVCITLKEIYGFKIREIVEITGLTEGKVKHAMSNARKRYIQIFENKCSLISKKGACHQCSELNGILNQRQLEVKELMSVKMIKEKDGQNFERLLNLRMHLIKSIDPLNSAGFDLHNYMLEDLPNHSE